MPARSRRAGRRSTCKPSTLTRTQRRLGDSAERVPNQGQQSQDDKHLQPTRTGHLADVCGQFGLLALAFRRMVHNRHGTCPRPCPSQLACGRQSRVRRSQGRRCLSGGLRTLQDHDEAPALTSPPVDDAWEHAGEGCDNLGRLIQSVDDYQIACPVAEPFEIGHEVYSRVEPSCLMRKHEGSRQKLGKSAAIVNPGEVQANDARPPIRASCSKRAARVSATPICTASGCPAHEARIMTRSEPARLSAANGEADHAIGSTSSVGAVAALSPPSTATRVPT